MTLFFKKENKVKNIQFDIIILSAIASRVGFLSEYVQERVSMLHQANKGKLSYFPFPQPAITRYLADNLEGRTAGGNCNHADSSTKGAIHYGSLPRTLLGTRHIYKWNLPIGETKEKKKNMYLTGSRFWWYGLVTLLLRI